MTNTQKQCLLVFLGYDTGGIGNGWGPKSRNAVEACQEDLGIPANGAWGPQTEAAVLEAVYTYNVNAPVAKEDGSNVGDFWDEIEFFDREEFRCQCGGKYCDGFHVEPDETMVRLCNEIRRRAGVPILIRDAGGSGLRCPDHNATIPGAAANSEHTKGRAADLHPRGKTPSQLYAIAEEVMAEMIPGRGGLGLYSWGIHVDVGKYSRWNG